MKKISMLIIILGLFGILTSCTTLDIQKGDCKVHYSYSAFQEKNGSVRLPDGSEFVWQSKSDPLNNAINLAQTLATAAAKGK